MDFDDDSQLLIPAAKARHIAGDISDTEFSRLEKRKEIEVVRAGRRVYVVAESLLSYVARLRETAQGAELP
jgi:hypothetical protein